MAYVEEITVTPLRTGLNEITQAITKVVENAEFESALCTIFIRHTSASLLIQENADPTAASDLERWFNRLVPEGDPLYEHTAEGPDDMPAHLKAALTAATLSIPIIYGQLALGTWQGIYLFEHRRRMSPRHLVIHIG